MPAQSKPNATKKLQGTFDSRYVTPQRAVANDATIPRPPRQLDAGAKKLFRELVSQHLFAVAELPLVAQLAQAHSHWLQALALIRQHGLLDKDGSRNTASIVLKDERAAYLAIAKTLRLLNDEEPL